TYDVGNRLTNIRKTSDGSTNLLTVTYTYDVEGKRVKEDKWVSGGSTTTTRVAYDGLQAWADLDNSNNLVSRYTWGEDRTQVVSRDDAGTGLRWLLQDNLSSIRDVVDASGAVADHLDYGVFGTIVTESHPNVTGRFAYTCFARVDTTGIYGS